MDAKTLSKLIAGGETARVEFKESFRDAVAQVRYSDNSRI